MQRRAFRLRQRRIRGLLDAVVQEPEPLVDERGLQRVRVDALEARQRHDQPVVDRGAQVDGGVRYRLAVGSCEHADVEAVADDGRHAKRLARVGWQLAEFGGEKVSDVLRDLGALHRCRVVAEHLRLVVEGDQLRGVQRLEELTHEERIAARFLANDLRQRLGRGRVLAQRIGDEAGDLADAERPQVDRVRGYAVLLLLAEREHEGMRGRHLVVAIGHHDQQRLGRRRCRDQIDEVQAGRVRPLHVVEKQHERMRPLAEDLHETLEDEVETVLRFQRLELGHARLRTDDELECRHHVDDELRVRVNGSADGVAPHGNRFLALREQLLHEILQGRDERAERHVLLQLIELAGDEVAALAGDRLIDLLDERGLADAGLPGDQDRLDPAARNALEALQQALSFGSAAVELLRRLESIERVVAAERERRRARGPTRER